MAENQGKQGVCVQVKSPGNVETARNLRGEDAEAEDAILAPLTRDEILNADDRKLVKVEVPEWNGHVFVRALSGKERDRWEEELSARKEMTVEGIMARLLTLAICNESGEKIFNPQDVVVLNTKSARAIQRIFNIAKRLNGIDDEDVEELAKNSEGGRSGDSGSS